MRVQGEVSIAIDGMQDSDVIDVGEAAASFSELHREPNENCTNCIVLALLGPKALSIDSRFTAVLYITSTTARCAVLSLCFVHFSRFRVVQPNSLAQESSVAVADLLSLAALVIDAA